jgi:DNA-binding Lrp family transcriptional regulator
MTELLITLYRMLGAEAYNLVVMTRALDELDGRLIHALAANPRAGVMELARQLRVARGTVQSRLDKLAARGIVKGYGPEIDPRAMGYAVLAFASIEIAQGRLPDVVEHLRAIPEVLEAHATTGPSDLHCRLVARSNEHLMDVINCMLEVQGITRTTTFIALAEEVPSRLLPLVDAASRS